MVHRLVVAILLLLLFSGLIVAGAWWYLQSDSVAMSKAIASIASKSKVPTTAPLELGEQFDPSVNTAMYVIDGVGRDSETLILRFVWPQIMSGKIVTSKISCLDSEIELHVSGQKGTRNVSKQDLFDKIETGDKASMIFSGLCSDERCSEIVRGCKLTVANEENK